MSDDVNIKQISARELYEESSRKRTSYLTRARYAAALTVPNLYPPDGSDGNTDYSNPYQSEGAKGVNNLANKMVLGLFPPNNTFFKMQLDPETKAKLEVPEAQIKEAMTIAEQAIIDNMEESGLRPKLVYLSKLSIVGGSAILYIPDEGDPEVFRLDCIAIKRDKKGNILEMIIKEGINMLTLDKKITDKLPKKDMSEEKIQGKKDLDIYTVIKRAGKKMIVWKEIEKVPMEETKASYKIEDCPYIFVPFVDTNEDYGRSYLEDYIGDLQSYEGLRQAQLEAAAESARIIYLLNPASVMSVKQVQRAKSGDVLVGIPDELQTLQNNKSMDMSVTYQVSQEIKNSLGVIFLLDSSVRRSGDRVTAEEIRTVSQELEVALGGIYSTLSTKVQNPMVRRYLIRCMKNGSIPSVFKDKFKVNIITGSAALGRGSEFNSLSTLLSTLQTVIGPDNYLQYMKPTEVISRLSYALGINTIGLIKTQEELAQEQQAAQQAQQEQTILEAEAPAAAQAQYNQGE